MLEGEEGSAGDRQCPPESREVFRSDSIGEVSRLIDVFRGATGIYQVTAGSPELREMVRQLARFREDAEMLIEVDEGASEE